MRHLYDIYYMFSNTDILTWRFYLLLLPCVYLYWKLPKFRRTILQLIGIVFFLLNGIMSLPVALYIVLTSWCTVACISKKQSQENERNRKIIKIIGLIASLMPMVILRMVSSSHFSYIIDGLSNRKYRAIFPIGVSYITLMAISYIVDYEANRCEKQKLGIHFLYLCFFPLAISGPIERPTGMFEQFGSLSNKKFDFDDFFVGITMIVYGLFAKLVVADRFGIVTNEVFDNYVNYLGYELLFALILYGIQLYIDFMACTTIVRGLGTCFGISITENFKQPYLSGSILDFWNRWHISLSTWLKDYVYIPLGGNRRGKLRGYINILVTFLVSGLWHGIGLNYIVWGVMHGIYQIIGRIIRRKGSNNKSGTIGVKLLNIALVFFLVDFAWLFFRVDIHSAFDILISITKGLDISFFTNNEYLNLGLNQLEWNIAGIGFLIICIVDCIKIKYRNITREKLKNELLIFRYVIVMFFLFGTIVFGKYGYNYDEAAFIYRGF